MSIELKIPEVGESIQEVQIGQWLKQEGDFVERDENVVELETDKASMELPAPSAGVLKQILKRDGEFVSIGDTIARIDEDGKAKTTNDKSERQDGKTSDEPVQTQNAAETEQDLATTPSARRALRKYGLQPEEIPHSGDRIHGQDVLRYVEHLGEGDDEKKADAEKESPQPAAARPAEKPASLSADSDLEEVVPMSLIRRRIAARLVEAQQKAALLTTFNEIDMSAVIALRKKYQERFQRRYNVKLGFMSFFVKAVIDALKQFPEINAEIRGDDIVYRNYYHMGIAIGSSKGLVAPVLRHAERMSFAEIELAIDDFAHRAGKNKLKPEELEGGTFTISNGGVYGSLLSTPIVNPPQSGVLGMHAIEERPVARAGQVVIHPMMYVALTYDHRLVDGQQAVTFLRRVKEAIEDPSRMLIEV